MDWFGLGVLIFVLVTLLRDRAMQEHVRLLHSRIAQLEGRPLCPVCQSVIASEGSRCEYCCGVPSWRHGVFHKGWLF